MPVTDHGPARPASGLSVSSRPGPSLLRPEVDESDRQTEWRRPDPYFRPGPCKRRRDVLMILLCTLTVTGLVGIIPALHVLLLGTAGVGAVLVGYIGLLIRLRNQALEREVKLRYLPRTTDYEQPVPLRRAASR
jgi:hypothetical protein